MLQSQIDDLKQEIDYLKIQIRELRDTVETLKPTELELPWHEAPDWAQWAAMDEDGEWWWYKYDPYCGVRCWNSSLTDDAAFELFLFPPCSNWKESKRKRP